MDLWAAGCVLHELLFLVPAFPAENLGALVRRLEDGRPAGGKGDGPPPRRGFDDRDRPPPRRDGPPPRRDEGKGDPERSWRR